MRDAFSFSNHYTVVTPCGPSRASLLTGQYAMNHRSVRNGTPLDPRIHHADDPALHSYEMPMPGFEEVVETRFDQSQPWRAHLAAQGYDLPPKDRFYAPIAFRVKLESQNTACR